MSTLKSRFSYLKLITTLIDDLVSIHGLNPVESLRDRTTVQSRYRKEGLSFLTKTLPSFGKCIDYALSNNTSLHVPAFSKRRGSRIPEFLGGFLERVFDSNGYVLVDASAVILRDIRQVLYLLYKLEVPYTEEQKQTVCSSFVSTDKDIGLDISNLLPESVYILEKARKFISRVLCNLDPRDILPRHGPGSVATGEKTWEKSRFSRIYSSVDQFYPFCEYFMYSLTHVADRLEYIQSLEILPTGTAKVVLVPKDSRGPRLISCEPLEIQWIQQGLSQRLVQCLERHPLTSGFVNFTDQSVNQNLALSSSIDSEYVTLDMKDASDRVSLDLVLFLFDGLPSLRDALVATRSTHTRMPSGELVELKKFAPMGSALCFPVESFVFFSLAYSVISSALNIPINKLSGYVFVYGDDLICKREIYPLIMQFFPLVKLKFNDAKCCIGSNFRESCGTDAFKGVNVTPLKIKTLWSHCNTCPNTLVSWVSYSNDACARGYHGLSKYIEENILSIYGSIPYLHSELDGYIGFYRPWIDAFNQNLRLGYRYKRCTKYQRLMIKASSLSPVRYKNLTPDTWAELLRRILSSDHSSEFGTYALPRRSRLVRGWSYIAYGQCSFYYTSSDGCIVKKVTDWTPSR